MISKFSDEYRFLSNFYPLINPIRFQDISYPTVEHFFQGQKTLDVSIQILISKCPTPGETKRMGKRVVIRNDWDKIKDLVMEKALFLKFSVNPDLARKLRDTGTEVLVEGNYWHDNYWGRCLCPRCLKIQGKNKLGTLLMDLRSNVNICC